jgi:metacaspase-1
VKKAAKALKAGDIFMLTYAGHGSFVPDFSGDEKEDGQDETWCLFDRQLLDDEIYEWWTWFREGVRIVVVSDSCHSGTIIRSTPGGLVEMDVHAQGANALRPRSLPSDVRGATIVNNRDLYRKVAAQTRLALEGGLRMPLRTRAIDMPLGCTVRLLSGCQDHQTSGDGDLNGLFTSRLLLVLERGFRGDYSRFHKEILKLMPAEQQPNHWTVGRKDPAFDGQQPFEI